MRDRILEYLLSTSTPQTSDRLLEAVLKISSPNAAAAEKVLRGIVGDDPRFIFENGAWHARAAIAAAEGSFPHALALFIEGSEGRTDAICLRGGLYRKDTAESLNFEFTGSTSSVDVEALGRWQAQSGRQLLIVWSTEMLTLWSRLLRACRLERSRGCVVCLRRLAARVLPRAISKIQLETLAADLGLPVPGADSPVEIARFFSACFDSLVEFVPEEHRFSATKLSAWVNKSGPTVDFHRLAFGKEYLRGLPESPGVYIMRNRAADIIYVGKAENLKRRVSSYFTSRALNDARTARIHEQLYSLETVPTPSELDALLLESQMIRDFRPPVNLQVEIHEQPARYGKGRNLILLAARPNDEMAQLYFLRDGIFEGHQSTRLGRPATKKLRARTRSLFFSARGRRRRRREAWEVEITSRWLARHRRQINIVDIDDAGDYESAVRQLNCYLLDPDRLSNKVLYR